jgi:hypothetical protein
MPSGAMLAAAGSHQRLCLYVRAEARTLQSFYSGGPYVTRIAVMTFGSTLTVPSLELVALPLTTGPVFLPTSTFFSKATVVSPNFD